MERTLVKNSIFSVLYRLSDMLFPLITVTYVSHIIMADGVGKVSFAQNIAQYFVLLAPLGIVNYGTREIAKIRSERTATNKLFSELFVINSISTIICSITYYGIVLFSGWFNDEKTLFIIAGTQILLNLINVEWYYQGEEKYQYIAIRNLVVKALSIIALFLLVRKPQDYVIYALIYVLGLAGNHLFNIYNLWKTGISFCFSELKTVKHLKPIFLLCISNIVIEIYVLSGTTILGIFCEDEHVGYYTNAIKLVKIFIGLISAIGSVLLPRLAFYKKEGRIDECKSLVNQVAMVILFFSVPCGVGICVLADELVVLMFGETFVPAISTVQILSLLMYVMGLGNLFGTQVLLAFNKEKSLLLATIVSAISNIVLNIILIPQYQHNGVAIATVISEVIVTVLTIVMSKKYVALKVSFSFYFKTLFASLCMLIGVLYVHHIVQQSILDILLSVLLGCIIYMGVSLLIKNQVFILANKFIKRGE